MRISLLCFIAVLALVAADATSIVRGQSRSLEVWEAETFEKQPPQKVMDAAGVNPGMAVGEVGAGRGRLTVHLARRVGPQGRVLANDIDEEALSFLRERCSGAGIDNVETILEKEDDALFPAGAPGGKPC